MFAIAGVIVAVRLALGRLSSEARALEAEQRQAAADQASLRRVATAVAGGCRPRPCSRSSPPRPGRLLGGEAAGIARYEGAGDRVVVLGVWSRAGFEMPVAVGDVYPISPDDPISRMRRSGTPVVVTDLDREDPRGAALGFRSLVAAPIHTGNRLWGAIVLGRPPDRDLPARGGPAPGRLRRASSRPRSPTPRSARAWTPRRGPTRSPA